MQDVEHLMKDDDVAKNKKKPDVFEVATDTVDEKITIPQLFIKIQLKKDFSFP